MQLSFKKGQKLSDFEAMSFALDQAERGMGRVSPNPLVGCVILSKEGHFLASGFHAELGGDHAEVAALKQLSKAELVGARVFVSLEPCSFVGRTPACAKLLAELPVSEVIYGVEDPNPKVRGQGHQIIANAGIKIRQFPEFENSCRELNEIFFKNQLEQKPFVAMKVATSLDGQMALASGESQWITGTEARHFGNRLRAQYDAILIGAGTFIADNPRLNIRQDEFAGVNNKVVVFTARQKIIEKMQDSNITKNHKAENIFVVTTEENQKKFKDKLKFSLLAVSANSKGELDINEAMNLLFQAGICSVLIEGGAKIYSSCLAENIVDRIYCFIAPNILGAGAGMSWTSDLSISRLSEKHGLLDVTCKRLGNDFLISGRLN